MDATVRPRVGHSVFKWWDGGEPCRDRPISSERFASRDYITSASLVPNVWEKISIDDSVVNVTKTWIIVSVQTFSASNGSYLVVIILPSVDNCRPKLQTDRYGITPIGRQRELSVHHSALRKRVTALRDLKANNRQSVEVPSSMRRLRCRKCLPLMRLMEPANKYKRSNRNLVHWLPR